MALIVLMMVLLRVIPGCVEVLTAPTDVLLRVESLRQGCRAGHVELRSSDGKGNTRDECATSPDVAGQSNRAAEDEMEEASDVGKGE